MSVADPDTTAASIRSGEKADHRAVDGARAGAAGEIRGENRARERHVGDGLPQRVGDDGRLDPTGQRSAVAPVLAQLEPAGVAHRRGEPLAALAVVEVGHASGAELACQSAGGASQLGLFGRVSGIHGRESWLLACESWLCKN